MKDINIKWFRFSILLIVALIYGCSSGGSGSDDDDEMVTYSTTSSKGDYSEWSIDGNNLTAQWNVVTDTGAIDYTFDIVATCGVPDSNGIRSCTVDSGVCTAGASACPGPLTGNFDMLDVPGVALFVSTDDSVEDEQLHIGFAKDSGSCADDVSGDYTFIRSGLGLDENFGMYRSDANFIDILHSDFGFDTTAFNVTPTVVYRTGTESEMLGDGGCVDGVRSRMAGTETIRSMMTDSGLFILDMPAGQGGLLSFRVDSAASIGDFANKSFTGISFPDNSNPEVISATSGASAGGRVTLAATVGTDALNIRVMALGTTDVETAPAYPDFSAAPTGYGAAALAADYATPNDIPGLFKFDGLSDEGRVILAAMKFNNKVIAMGMVYNFRDGGETNPSTGLPFSPPNLYNTGNFLLFER